MTTYKDILILVDKVTSPLKNISDQMKKTAENGDKLKDKVNKIRERFDKLRPSISKAWAGIKKLTVGFLALVGAGGILVRGIAKVTEFADHIDKMSQKIGMSAQAYQKWNYVLQINGGNIDSLGMGFKTLTNQIAMANKGNKEATGNFKRLGIRLTDSQGKLRKTEDVFNETVKAIQRIQNPTEKAIISNKLFGRSAMEMRPLLNMTAEEFDKLAENVKKYGLSLTDEDIERATKFKDTWTTFTNFIQINTMKAMSDLYPKLQEVLDKVMAHKEEIMTVIKAVGWLIYQLVKLIATIGMVANAFARGFNYAVGIIKKASEWAENLIEKLGKIAYFIPFLNTPLIREAMARQYDKNISNNVRQNQTINNSSNTTTNNFYNGNTTTYNGLFGPGALYAH